VAYFLVTSVWGPSRDPSRGRREQDGWDEHAAFMDGLVEDGFVVLGGPVDEEKAMLLVEAADEDEVRARLAEDPWRTMGMLETGELRPWTIWLDRREITGAR
jgi:uncharacterized protein